MSIVGAFDCDITGFVKIGLLVPDDNGNEKNIAFVSLSILSCVMG